MTSNPRADIPGMTIIHAVLEAAAQGHLLRLKLLLARGVDVDICNSMNRTALHLACAEGHCHIVRFLIKHGASWTIKDSFGNNAMQEAIKYGHMDVIDILIQNGDQCTEEDRGETEASLRNYAFLGNLTKIKNLIRGGTSASCLDYLGNSPLHLAVQQNKLDVVVFLLGVKADIYCKNSNSDTPLSIAQANHDQCLVRILKREGSRSSNDITKTLLEGNDISRACSSSHKSVTSLQIAGCASFAVMQSCPAPIARALLSKHAIEPLSRSMASLFFSDIVGFTEISSKLTASKVSTLLHALAKVIHSRSTLSVLPPTPAERSTSPRCRPLTALPTSTGSRRWTLSATPT